MARTKHLQVQTPVGLAGDLHRQSQYVFNYSSTERSREVSLTMPLRAQGYASNPLMPVFGMNLPEGFLYDRIARRIAKHEPIDDMRMLEITGRQQIGRLEFVNPEMASVQTRPSVGLSRLLEGTASGELFEFLIDSYFNSGISGVQPKVMLPDADHSQVDADDRLTVVHSDLIVKASGIEYPQLTQNEFICIATAARAGIDVPEHWLSADGSLFVMRRFDLDPQLRGFEDLAVLMGKARDPQGNYKYTESYEAIARVVSHYSGENAGANLAAFFDYVCFSVMVRNGDAHLKNFGMLYDDPSSGEGRLAPMYDVVTTTLYPYFNQRTGNQVVDRTMALKLFSGARSKNYPDRADLIRFGKTVCLVRRPEQVIDRIAAAMSESLAQHGNLLDAESARVMEKEWMSARQSVMPATSYGAR